LKRTGPNKESVETERKVKGKPGKQTKDAVTGEGKEPGQKVVLCKRSAGKRPGKGLFVNS